MKPDIRILWGILTSFFLLHVFGIIRILDSALSFIGLFFGIQTGSYYFEYPFRELFFSIAVSIWSFQLVFLLMIAAYIIAVKIYHAKVIEPIQRVMYPPLTFLAQRLHGGMYLLGLLVLVHILAIFFNQAGVNMLAVTEQGIKIKLQEGLYLLFALYTSDQTFKWFDPLAKQILPKN